MIDLLWIVYTKVRPWWRIKTVACWLVGYLSDLVGFCLAFCWVAAVSFASLRIARCLSVLSAPASAGLVGASSTAEWRRICTERIEVYRSRQMAPDRKAHTLTSCQRTKARLEDVDRRDYFPSFFVLCSKFYSIVTSIFPSLIC